MTSLGRSPLAFTTTVSILLPHHILLNFYELPRCLRQKNKKLGVNMLLDFRISNIQIPSPSIHLYAETSVPTRQDLMSVWAMIKIPLLFSTLSLFFFLCKIVLHSADLSEPDYIYLTNASQFLFFFLLVHLLWTREKSLTRGTHLHVIFFLIFIHWHIYMYMWVLIM